MADFNERWQPSGGERTLEQVIRESGQRLAGRNGDPRYLARLVETTRFINDVLDGRRPSYLLREALSTSDFPLLMGDILDRQLLGRYNETVPTWQNYCRRGLVRDFRTVRRLAVDGLEGRYAPAYKKPEETEPQENNGLSETGYTYAVDVYEKATALDWKMIVNDDLQAFRDIPDRLARGARRTEEYFATTLFADASGPHASLYTAGNKNLVNATNAGAGFTAINPPLSIAGLQQAFVVLANQKDADGEPILIDAVELVVPPALRITAENILNAIQLWLDPNPAAATAKQSLVVNNWMRNQTRLSVNAYLPVVSTTNGNTAWYLFANPQTSRPALEVGFLQGYETPGLYMKAPNTLRLGGGLVPELGDFDSNEQRYKGMHIIGGTRLEPRATVASNGSGA